MIEKPHFRIEWFSFLLSFFIYLYNFIGFHSRLQNTTLNYQKKKKKTQKCRCQRDSKSHARHYPRNNTKQNEFNLRLLTCSFCSFQLPMDRLIPNFQNWYDQSSQKPPQQIPYLFLFIKLLKNVTKNTDWKI